MICFLLLGTNQFAVLTDNRARRCDNSEDKALTLIAVKTGAQESFLQVLESRWSLCCYK